MMRKYFEILLLTLIVLGLNDIGKANGDTIFHDNFDTDLMGIFPSIGGWQLLYDGSGGNDQFVDNLYSVSHNQSIRLEGSSCWSAFAYHAVVALPTKMTFEANVYLGPNVSCGCGPALAALSLFNPNIGSRGTGFGGVSFNCDGYIYGGIDGDINDSGGNGKVMLMPYHPNTWYNIRIELDMVKRISAVYIDDVLKAAGIKLTVANDAPTGLVLCGGYSINNPVWYDDVCVLDVITSTQATPAPTGSATLTTDGLLTIPYLQFLTLTGMINLWSEMQLVNQCNPPDICFKVTTYGTN